MLPGTSFFEKTAAKKSRFKSNFIDVGGDPFYALAVAAVDNLKNGAFLTDVSLKKILERFFTYFPNYKINQSHLIPVEQMRLLVKSPRKAEIITCLAYVFRQLTLDTIFASPLGYTEVFRGLNNTLRKDQLREMNRRLPACALGALAEAINITLILLLREPKKELWKQQVYNSGVDAPFEIVLQVQDDTYFPKVKNKNDFIFMGQLATRAPAPLIIPSEENISDVLSLIAEDDATLWLHYEEYRTILTKMIADKVLTLHSLINLYTKFLSK